MEGYDSYIFEIDGIGVSTGFVIGVLDVLTDIFPRKERLQP
jgi:hypothetical protein